MKKNIKKLLCLALFLSISSATLPADGWQIPLISKLADYSNVRKLFLVGSTIWTACAIRHMYPAFKKDYESPKKPNIFVQYRVSLGFAAATAGVGALAYGVYCWPHLKALQS